MSASISGSLRLCPAKIRYAGIKTEKEVVAGSWAWHLCRAMSSCIRWLRLMSVLVLLFQDVVRFLLLGTRSSAALKAENLFLRKQLAHVADQSRVGVEQATSNAPPLTGIGSGRNQPWSAESQYDPSRRDHSMSA